MAVQSIPQGYHTITPYISVPDPDAAIRFMQGAFGARELMRFQRPDGHVAHAEVQVGDSRLMLAQASPEWPAQPGSFHLYVEDVDACYARALAAGAASLMEPADQFYGDRHGGVEDPAGNRWWIATHVEDVSEEEMRRRAAEYFAAQEVGAPAAT